MLSKRIQKIQPSATLAINAKAIELKKQGVDILKFGTGEPDCDTPDNIKEAAKKALDEGFTKYTAATGITELKEAVVDKLKRDNQINCEVGNVLITNGGKQALYNCFMAILDPGDEVIIPSPYWVSYADMVAVCEGESVYVDTTPNNFKLTAEMVQSAITPKTKCLILNSPSNPTGMIIEKEEIEKIGKLALEHKFYVISDEVYEYFLYDEKEMFSIGSISELKDLVFTVNAVSKSYSMTGWRIGYIAGPKEVIKPMGSLQSHATSNPCSIAQKAALEALTGPQDSVKMMAEEFAKRRDYVYEEMNKLPGFKLVKPEGAFYAFPDVSEAFTDEVNDSFKFTEFLMEKAKIAVVPGGAFGKEGDKCIRFSYASSMEDIEEGIKRIQAALS
jgi:aspartate aminotransferase